MVVDIRWYKSFAANRHQFHNHSYLQSPFLHRHLWSNPYVLFARFIHCCEYYICCVVILLKLIKKNQNHKTRRNAMLYGEEKAKSCCKGGFFCQYIYESRTKLAVFFNHLYIVHFNSNITVISGNYFITENSTIFFLPMPSLLLLNFYCSLQLYC